MATPDDSNPPPQSTASRSIVKRPLRAQQFGQVFVRVITSARVDRYSYRKHIHLVVKVLVGPKERPFAIHQGLLITESDFFHNALKGGWKEGDDGVIRLPEEYEEPFMVLSHWLYTGVVDPSVKYGGDVDKDDALAGSRGLGRCQLFFRELAVEKDECDAECSDARSLDKFDWDMFVLVLSYILGDKLQSPGFKNAVIDFLIQYHFISRRNHKKMPNCPTIRYAFENTPERSCLRNLLLDMVVWCPDYAMQRQNLCSSHHVHFLAGCARGIQDRLHGRVKAAPFEGGKTDGCARYHEHKEGTASC